LKKNIISLSIGAVIIASSLFVAGAAIKTTTTKINGTNFTAVTVKGKQYVDKNQVIAYLNKTKGNTAAKSKLKGISFSNTVIKGEYGTTTVNGEVMNHDKTKHSFTLTVSFYDKNKKLLGTAVGTVNDLSGGATKTFDAVATGDYSKAASTKVEVDTMVE
jgi:hypothetical protein